MTDETTGRAAGRARSPRSPTSTLSECVEMIGKIHAKERANPIAAETAVVHLGYSPTSSGGRQALATLRQFGLLSTVVVSGKRNVALTRLAQDIILYRAPEHRQQRAEALRTAALAPDVHQKVVERYPHGLPSDAELRVFLVRDLGFLEDSAAGFIAQLRETLSFAGLEDGARIGAMQADSESDPPAEEPEMTSTVPPLEKAAHPQPLPPTAGENLTALIRVKRASGLVVVVYGPAPMDGTALMDLTYLAEQVRGDE